MPDISDLEKLIEPHGLVVLGLVSTAETAPPIGFEEWPESGQIALVGNAGSTMWSALLESPEYGDGEPNPLDRWSRRVGDEVASLLGARAVFPFEGPPYPPVLEWARLSGAAFPSPLSMFIHARYGLWHAYRIALIIEEPLNGSSPVEDQTSPCLSCLEQPCLQTCPVNAFTQGGYRVDDCVGYLDSSGESDCRKFGCAARKACPVTRDFHYVPEHAAFHMDAFVRAQLESV